MITFLAPWIAALVLAVATGALAWRCGYGTGYHRAKCAAAIRWRAKVIAAETARYRIVPYDTGAIVTVPPG